MRLRPWNHLPQFTDSTLQPLGLVFRPAFILLHASADPPAGLSSYGGFDTYGEGFVMLGMTTFAAMQPRV